MMPGTMHTVSGSDFCPFKESMGKVDIGDIAWALAHQCRYNGHVDRFYSVANHCMVMARFFINKKNYKDALEALMHDAAEAYVGDMAYPLKKLLPQFTAIENRVQGYLLKELGLHEYTREHEGAVYYVQSPLVRKLDKRMIEHESSILRSSLKDNRYDPEIGDLYDMPPDMMAGQFEVLYEQLVDRRHD